MLDELEQRTFAFFKDSANTANGQIPDHWPDDHSGDYFSSIASIGYGLTAYGIGVERGWMKRGEAVRRTLATLCFFNDAPQGEQADATGYNGFYYHFLDMAQRPAPRTRTVVHARPRHTARIRRPRPALGRRCTRDAL